MKNLWNSLFLSTASVAVGLVLGVPAAYAFARLKFRGSEDIAFTLLSFTRVRLALTKGVVGKPSCTSATVVLYITPPTTGWPALRRRGFELARDVYVELVCDTYRHWPVRVILWALVMVGDGALSA